MVVSSGKEVDLSPEMDSRLERKAAHPFWSMLGSSYVNGSQTYMCRVKALQVLCVCRTTNGSVIAGSSDVKAVKLVSWFNILKDNWGRVKQHSRTLSGSFMAPRKPRVLNLGQS
ncbi:hypothetical protein TNCV_4932771 [Trichonephila clavipes]|nr:hypothetical protein TNCV_4932771 [Trichonephila clavipes]